MDALIKQQCEICRPGSESITERDQKKYIIELPKWSVFSDRSVKKLSREFTFKNFIEALVFINKIGELAELNQHHPEIHLQWGKVVVTWWTHSINGLHKNDFILAAKSDDIFLNE